MHAWRTSSGPPVESTRKRTLAANDIPLFERPSRDLRARDLGRQDGEMVRFKRSKSFHGMRPRRLSGYLRVSLGDLPQVSRSRERRKNRMKGKREETRALRVFRSRRRCRSRRATYTLVLFLPYSLSTVILKISPTANIGRVLPRRWPRHANLLLRDGETESRRDSHVRPKSLRDILSRKDRARQDEAAKAVSLRENFVRKQRNVISRAIKCTFRFQSRSCHPFNLRGRTQRPDCA